MKNKYFIHEFRFQFSNHKLLVTEAISFLPEFISQNEIYLSPSQNTLLEIDH